MSKVGSEGQRIPNPATQVSQTILNKAITSTEPLMLLDALGDAVFSTQNSVTSLQLRSIVCVPLITYHRTLGVIYVENRSEANIFTEEDVEPLTHFATQAAVFIENALLNEDLEAQVQAQTEELREANVQLQQALDSIKTLKGFIPICANCKNIRDDEGFWKRVEVYISEHSEAEFSHSICPDCIEVLYPQLKRKG